MKKIIYHSLKQYCTIALHFYFSRWQVDERSPIPSGPVIFVPNHQNAFLDAILISCSGNRNPWFLTRSTVFNEFTKKILATLQMSPVYRFRDGFGTLRKNDEVIENCVKLLSQQKSILIFGEGNHNNQWFLRPLQKGFARIAIAAEEKNNWKLGVKIVPVGVQYESHNDFRAQVLVTFGNPILVNDYYQAGLGPQENVDILLKKTSEGMKELILHIDPEQYESKLNYWRSHRELKNDLVEQLLADQNLVAHIPPADFVPASKDAQRSPWWNPIRIYEYINHFLPRSILRLILKNKIKDPQFIGSIKFVAGMVLVPVFYIIQTGLCYAISQSWPITLTYFISLPISILLRR